MAGLSTSFEADAAEDSFEDEVFFGPLTNMEARLARRLMKRRTELYIPAFSYTRPSLEEFRHSNKSITDYFPSESTDDFVDSLDENVSNDVSACIDSGFDSKPCTDIDGVEDIQNRPASVGSSFCTSSTTYFSAESEADNQVAQLEDSLNDTGKVSMSSAATYYSATYEDSLCNMGRISSGSRIEQANDSLVVHASRRSHAELSDSIRHSQLFDNEGPGGGEVVSESSFEQDSLSKSENGLGKQMEHHNLKVGYADAFKIDSLEEAAKCDVQTDVSQNILPEQSDTEFAQSSNSASEHWNRLSSGSYSVLPAPPTSPESSLESISFEESELAAPERSRAAEEEYSPITRCSATQVTIERHEVGENYSSLSPDGNSDGGKVSKQECGFITLTFSPAKHFLSVLNFKKLLISPLSSCNARNSGSAHAENSDAPEKMASTDADASQACTRLEDSIIPSTSCDHISRKLEIPEFLVTDTVDVPLDMSLKNECCEDGELALCPQSDDLVENESSEYADVPSELAAATINQCAVKAPDLKVENSSFVQPSDDLISEATEVSENFITISPRPVSSDTVAVPKCTMVDFAMSFSQSEEVENDVMEQGCQTSFLDTHHAAESVGRACGTWPSVESPSVLSRTPLSNQKAQRIPIFKAAIGPPCRTPTFKTPTKPALRVLAPCFGSGSKSRITPKASPVLTCSSQDNLKRLAPGKSRFDHITSPVAKYIKDSAVPPLISNSRPIATRSKKLGTTPNTKIPVPTLNSSSKKPSSAMVKPTNKRILVPSNKCSKSRLPLSKAKNQLDFGCNVSEESKENSSIEDSIFEELKITFKQLGEINNKKLKKDVLDYVKTRKAMIVNAGKESNLSGGNNQNTPPCLSYKGASSLAIKHVDLVTELHTIKNKKIVCSPNQPTILKHTGERKVLHWANGLVTDVDALSSPFHPKIIAPAIYMKTAHKKSVSSVDDNLSTVDVSIVEVVNPIRTNTLAKK